MKSKETSNKSFGILFFLIFLAIGIWPILNSEDPRIWSIIISLIFLVRLLLKCRILKPLKDVWIKFGEILGKIIAPIVMAVVFFIILTPTGLLLRLFGKDLLKTKPSKGSSYWIHRSKDIGSMKKQF